MRGKITAAAVGGLLAAGLPSGVAVAEPGLTVDPQSPAGVEYAIPLDSGRGHGGGGHGHPSGGGSGGGGGGGGNSALFGSGITPPASGSSATHASGSGTRAHRHGRGGSGKATSHGSPNARSGDGATPPGVAPVSAAASYSTSGPIAGVVGGILALGGGLGLFLRLRARRTTSEQQRH